MPFPNTTVLKHHLVSTYSAGASILGRHSLSAVLLQNLEEQKKLLLEHMKQNDYQEALQSFTSPLNNSHILGDLS